MYTSKIHKVDCKTLRVGRWKGTGLQWYVKLYFWGSGHAVIATFHFTHKMNAVLDVCLFRRQNQIHPDLGPVFSIFSAFPSPPHYYLWRSCSVVVCIGQCLLTVGILGPSSWHIEPCRWILCGWVCMYTSVCNQGRTISHQMAPGLTTASYKKSCSEVLEQVVSFPGLQSQLMRWKAW